MALKLHPELWRIKVHLWQYHPEATFCFRLCLDAQKYPRLRQRAPVARRSVNSNGDSRISSTGVTFNSAHASDVVFCPDLRPGGPRSTRHPKDGVQSEIKLQDRVSARQDHRPRASLIISNNVSSLPQWHRPRGSAKYIPPVRFRRFRNLWHMDRRSSRSAPST